MTLWNLLLIYVFIKGIDKLREEFKKREKRDLSPTAEKIVEIVTFICAILVWVWIIAVFIILFF